MKRQWAVPMVLVAAAAVLNAEPGEPGRGVARVSLINGDITTQRGDSGDWTAAAVNAPLVTGDRVVASRASRAEIQLDHANFLRIGENTEVRLADLEGRRYQIQLSHGILTYRILRDLTADVEINTPQVAVRPIKRGIYRVHVLESGDTEITVRDGEAEVFSPDGSERLREDRTMIVRRGATERDVQVQVVRASGRDDWDRWNERRDDWLKRSKSYQYVNSSIYGVEDLDHYGSWRVVVGYGPVWFPQVAYVGWSPYSWGRWVWVDWYGWTWVGYEPWAWAPYHYGRWFHHASWGWGWCPGAIYTRHYWSPALVGFFGWGGRNGFSVGVGFGYSRIGWVPLAPGEPYYPWYGRGYYGRGNRVYVDNSVNITNINVRNVYRNANVHGGIVSIDPDNFARGRVDRAQRVNVAEIRNAGQIRGLVPVVPDRESLRFSDRELRTAAISRTAGREDRFFAKRQPTQIERVPFAEQQQVIARSVRGGGRRAEDQGSTLAPAGNPSETRSIRSLADGPGPSGTPQSESRRGWRRTGESAPGGAAQSNVDRTTGWRRFGGERRIEGESVLSPGRRETTPERVVTDPQNNQNNERRLDRNSSGWRRFGDNGETRSPSGISPQRERNFERRPGFGELGGSSQPRRSIRDLGSQPDTFRQPQRERAQPRSIDPGFRGNDSFRRSEPRFENRGARQLELNRPIVVPRGRSEGRDASQAPPSGGNDGGRRVERSGPPRGRR